MTFDTLTYFFSRILPNFLKNVKPRAVRRLGGEFRWFGTDDHKCVDHIAVQLQYCTNVELLSKSKRLSNIFIEAKKSIKISRSRIYPEWCNMIRQAADGTTEIWRKGGASERLILDRYAQYMNRLTWFCWSIGWLTTSSLSVTTLVLSFTKVINNSSFKFEKYLFSICIAQENITADDKPPSLIMASWFPYKNHYYISYAIQLYVIVMASIVISAWNTLMIALMAYAIILLKLFNFKLKYPKVYIKQYINLKYFNNICSYKKYLCEQVIGDKLTEKRRYELLTECIEMNIYIIKWENCVFIKISINI